MQLELRVLGPPEVLLGGVPVRLETRKAIAILAYLALEGTQRRDTFDALLWPDSDAKRARGALRRTLSALRKALPDGALADGDDVALRLDLTMDLARARELLDGTTTPPTARDVAPLVEADRLHRGGFLEGLTFRDAAPFEDWRVALEAQVRRRHATILERSCQAYVTAGDLGAAVDAAERRLQLDPLHEPSHQQLMLLHSWRGDRTNAAEQYRTCVRVLDRELGVSPLDRTTRLYRAVLAGEVLPRHQPGTQDDVPADPGPASTSELPLVGRDDERARLVEVHRAATHGGQVVVVTGEAGIGKSRLVTEHADWVAEQGGRTVVVHVEEGDRAIAYAPVTAILRQVVPDLDDVPEEVRAEVARLVPQAGAHGTSAPVDSPAAQTRFVQACVRVITEHLAGGEAPGLLVVDDVDRADRESLELLTYLCARASEDPLVVVLTWRSGSEADGVVPRSLPRGTDTLALDRLTGADVATLARAGGAADDAEPLYRESEGVPYLVVSYLVARHERDSWDLPPPGRELVRARVDVVSEISSQVLSAAAVLGRSTPLDVLARVSGRSDIEVVEAVEELTARRILAEHDDGAVTYAFTHDKLRAVVYEDTGLARRRLLHGRAADVLKTLPGTPAATLGHHLAAAGREEDAAAAHAEAGVGAARLFANAEAVEHLEAALALGHPDATALLVQLGDALVRLGRYADAADRYTRAASRGADPVLVEHRLGQLRLREGDPRGARAHLERALRLDPPEERSARLQADLALAALHLGELTDASWHAGVALELAEASGDPDALARAHNLLGVVGRRTGHIEAARTHLTACLAVADADEPRAAALNNLSLVLRDAGEHQAAVVTAEEALTVVRAVGDRHREAALLSNLADALHAAGRTEEALDYQREAAERFAGVGDDPARTPEIWQLVDW